VRLYRLNHLPEETRGHVFRDLVAGDYLAAGELLFIPRGRIAHEDEAVHAHDTEEVFVILQGKATVHFDDADRAIGPGDVMVIDPEENHHLESDSEDPCVMLYLHFGAERHPAQGGR
jgi:mannose-6-phosphate isomerase-like protein (cupin superfamily)